MRPDFPRRKRNRLHSYDYREAGYYFITICTRNRKEYLSSILVGNGLDRSARIRYTQYGEIAHRDLLALLGHFPNVRVDRFAIMPNHVHVILVLEKIPFTASTAAEWKTGETERSRPFPTISTVIGQYKSGVSRKAGFPLWQKSFYDHIIRNEQDYWQIAHYIETNPLRWKQDRFYPQPSKE